jgi:hypothetical protein
MNSRMDTARLLMVAVVTVATAGTALGDDFVPPQAMNLEQAYAAARVDTAFDLVAAMSSARRVMVPMAMKGDLPIPLGCLGTSGDMQAECMDVAYELPGEPSIVVGTTEGTTTKLMRMHAMTIAGTTDERLR